MSIFSQPLAETLRPKTLDEVIGQQHIAGPQGVLKKMLESGRLPSIIFWGPPGVGKTTLAQILAHESKAQIFFLSAISAGVKEVRDGCNKPGRRLDSDHSFYR